MPQFRNKEEYEKWKAQGGGGSPIQPIKKDLGTIIPALLLAGVNTLVVLLIGGIPVYLLFGRSPISFILFMLLIIATPVWSIVSWLKRYEAECPYCNERVHFADSARGVTCKACKKRSVVKGNRLIQVT